MLDRTASPFSPPEMAAMRLLLADRGVEVLDRTVLIELQAKGFVRQSAEGWSVTLAGHVAYLREGIKCFE